MRGQSVFQAIARFCGRAVMALLLLTVAARAESASDPAPNLEELFRDRPPARNITADEFRQAFEGKTVHLSFAGTHYGSEYYLPGDRSVWVRDDGPCRQGDWTFERAQFCFRYDDDGPYCWRVFEQGGVYYADSLEGLILRIYAVDEKPLVCDPELYS